MKPKSSEQKRNLIAPARHLFVLILIVLAVCAAPAPAQHITPTACLDPVQPNIVRFGYNNTISPSTVTVNPGPPLNYFYPGKDTYPNQVADFQGGLRNNTFAVSFDFQSGESLTWVILGSSVTVNLNTPRCTTINYQGRLNYAGAAANGNFDLTFKIYNQPTGGAAQTDLVTTPNVPVANGIFTANLFFGSMLIDKNPARYLEIGIRPAGQNPNDPYTILQPRQPLTDVPFAANAQSALSSLNATNATNAANADKLGNVAANQYVLTTDPRLSATNNPNFIQNTTIPQTGNFSISGNGTVGGTLTANSFSGNGANLTGLFSIYSLSGPQSGPLPANASGYSFIGQTQYVTLTANQRLTGAGSIPLAVSSGTVVASVGLCYSLNFGTITNFTDSSTNTIIGGDYTIYAASATVKPGAGTVQFGLCVGRNAQPLLSNAVNGWMMVTNN